MAQVKSISLKDNEAKDFNEKLEQLRIKEHSTVSKIIIMALNEYHKNHADGNPCFTITDFQDPEFMAIPGLMRENKIHSKYLIMASNDDFNKYCNKHEQLGHVIRNAERIRDLGIGKAENGHYTNPVLTPNGYRYAKTSTE